MRYLALTININNEIPNHREGLMKEIVDYFVNKGYSFAVVHDKTTIPNGFYLFETDKIGFTSFSDFKEFLNKYEEKGVKYKLVELEDVLELSLRSNQHSIEL